MQGPSKERGQGSSKDAVGRDSDNSASSQNSERQGRGSSFIRFDDVAEPFSRELVILSKNAVGLRASSMEQSIGPSSGFLWVLNLVKPCLGWVQL